MAYELRDRQMDAERVLFKEPTIPPEVAEYEEPVNMEGARLGCNACQIE